VFDHGEYHNLHELIFDVLKWGIDNFNTQNDNFPAQCALTLMLNIVDTPHVLLHKFQPDLDCGNSHLVLTLKKIIDSLVALPLSFSADLNDFYNIFVSSK
jgi:hypothetical protein